MNRERPNAGNICRLQRAKHGVLEEAAAETLALPGGRNRKPGQQHDGDGIAGKALGQALGRVAVFDLSHHKRVVTCDLFIRQGDVGLRGPGLLVLKRVPYQEAVEGFPAAVERIKVVAALKLFDAERGHLCVAALEHARFLQKLA